MLLCDGGGELKHQLSLVYDEGRFEQRYRFRLLGFEAKYE